jgi:hypothetical protein
MKGRLNEYAGSVYHIPGGKRFHQELFIIGKKMDHGNHCYAPFLDSLIPSSHLTESDVSPDCYHPAKILQPAVYKLLTN